MFCVDFAHLLYKNYNNVSDQAFEVQSEWAGVFNIIVGWLCVEFLFCD